MRSKLPKTEIEYVNVGRLFWRKKIDISHLTPGDTERLLWTIKLACNLLAVTIYVAAACALLIATL